METLQDGGFDLRQQKFVEQLEFISLSQRRSRADTDKLTPGEFTQLQGVSGSANWLGNQTRPDLCVTTSLLQGAHASATVADAREANKTHSFVSTACTRANSSLSDSSERSDLCWFW